MKKLKVFFEAACSLKAKFPLGSFILTRLVTMLVILFLLGWAIFALMALAPGDIVDQMMQQQIMSQTSGTGGASTANNKVFNEEQMAILRS